MQNMIFLSEDAETLEEQYKIEKIERSGRIQPEHNGQLNTQNTPLIVDVADIDQYPNQTYALLRKQGLGTSDSSALLGVNPYTSRNELIAEKARNYLTEEELGIGDLTAVKKGRDLEPLIIEKANRILQREVLKPTDMYRHAEYPWIKFNFDGVLNDPEQYIPVEIKVVTYRGEKHYNRNLALFDERVGAWNPQPDNFSQHNNSIETKAGQYGIPPYYYTQLQQQIMGLNAPYGYLAVLFDNSWDVVVFFVWRDDKVINALITEGYKVWSAIEERRGPGWTLPLGLE